MLSGESGLPTLKETLQRIAKSKGIALSDVTQLFLSEWLPRFDNLQNLASIDLALQDTGAKVLIVDPTYFCMRGENAGNLFSQGEALRGITEVCRNYHASLVLVHHTRKRSKNQSVYSNPDLDNLSWSGFAEMSRQWLLLERREEYIPGTGSHKLLLDAGGAFNQGSRWALDIEEGTDSSNRCWNVKVFSPEEARTEKKSDSIRQRILDAASDFPGAETKTAIFTVARLRSDAATKIVFDALVAEGRLVPCKVTKNGASYNGFTLMTEKVQ